MSEDSLGEIFKNLKLDDAMALGTSFLVSGLITFAWVSLPFFLVESHLPLFYLGVIYSIGVLFSVLARIPLRFYSERARTDILPGITLTLTGIALSLLFIVTTIPGIVVAFVILSIAVSAYRIPKKSQRQKGLRNIEPMRNMYSQEIVSNTGIFILLIFAALFVSGTVRELYGITSVIGLLVGVLSLVYLVSKRSRANTDLIRTSIRAMVLQSLEPLKSFDRISSRKILIPYLAVQSLLYLSLCIVAVFLPAMGLHDGVTRQEIFLIFAAFSVIAFLLDRSAALIPMKFIRETFYLFRPIFLIIPLLILSLLSNSVIFIIGYFTLLLWVFSDAMSSDVVFALMPEGDRIRAPILMNFLAVPIGIVGPVLGSLFWLASPRLLYGVAILPAAISLLLAMMALQGVSRRSATRSL